MATGTRFVELTTNRPFRALWLARTTSYLGDYVSFTTILLYLYDRDASPTQLGVALAARAVPQALGPVFGALADRSDPRLLMITCDVLRVATVGAIAVTLPPFPVFVSLIAATSILTTGFLPAGKSCVPMLVDRDRLGNANAMLGLSHNVALALGPVAGAFLVQLWDVRVAFGVDAASYLVSAALLTALPALRTGRNGRSSVRLYAEIGEGLRYLVRSRVPRAVALGMFLAVLFAAMDNVALVYLVRQDAGGGPAAVGVMTGAYGVGMIIAPALLAGARWPVSGAPLLLLGLALVGLGLAATGAVTIFPLMVAVYAVAGAGNGFENVACDTLIGTNVERDRLGRIFGAVYAPIFLAETASSLAGGWLVAKTSAPTVFVVAGVGVLVVALLVWLMLRPFPGYHDRMEDSRSRRRPA